MAGDENGADHHGASGQAGPPVDPKPGAAPAGMPTAPLQEWTASDARGPLNEAGAAPEIKGSDAYAASGFDREPDPEPSAGTMSEPTESTAPGSFHASPEPHRSSSLWPIAAGLIVGAIIGAGSAYVVYASATGDIASDAKIAALTARVDALDKRPDAGQALTSLNTSIADLTTKVAAADAAARAASAKADAAAGKTPPGQSPSAGPDLSALPQKVASLETTLGTVQQQAAQAAPAGDLKAAKGKIDTVDASLGDVQKQLGGVSKQAASAQSDIAALQAGQKTLEGKITSAPALAVVADSLVQQIDRGLPYAAQVGALDSLGVDPAKLAVLRQYADQGVPSASALADKFEPLTDTLLAAEYRPKPNTGFWDRMKDGVTGLVSIHRVGDVEGDDVPSRVARIKADLAHGDVVDAVTTWTKLPADAKAKPDVAAWGALAKTHAEAITAANAVLSDAIASLGAKKS